jgi:hypothetical protein
MACFIQAGDHTFLIFQDIRDHTSEGIFSSGIDNLKTVAKIVEYSTVKMAENINLR